MTTPANSVTTLISIGNREDLDDTITRVAPSDTPLTSNIGKKKVSAVYSEWQTETLRSASATASTALEGGTPANVAGNLTARVGNTCQINLDARQVTGTQEVVDKAGRASEVTRQKVLLGLELKRDFELAIMGNNAAVAEVADTTTRKTGSIQAWITSNVSRGSGGSNGGFTATPGPAAATNGTQRAFTETLVKAVMATGFGNGAKPSQAYMGGTHKQQFSAFTGIADIRLDATKGQMAQIIGAADMYVSDFGKLALIPHPYGLTRSCVLVDPDKAAVGTLRGWTTEPLAKTADSERFMVKAEKCLVVMNEKAHAIVADLT